MYYTNDPQVFSPEGGGQEPKPPQRDPGRARTIGIIAAAVLIGGLAVFGAYAAVTSLSGHSTHTASPPNSSNTTGPSGANPPTSLPGYTLKYTQEFNGNSLPAGWNAYNKATPGGESSSTAQWKSSMCTVSGGEAHFMASGIDSCGMAFDGMPQQYGAFFARIKGDSEPAGMSFSDIFLLWPASNQWPPEIDIYEDNGGSRNITYSSMFNNVNGFCGSNPAQGCLNYFEQTNRPRGVPNNGTQWHTYGVEWTPSGVTWLVDGKVIYRAPASAVKSPAQQPSQPMDMVLQSQNLKGAGTPNTRQTMAVDWVAQFSYNGS